jgi:dethiobiotin synthetase
MHGVLVTGTDTGVGKTIIAACIAAALRERGLRVAAVKPAVTGLYEPEPGRPADHELLAAAAGVAPGSVTERTFGPPLSPHLAAELAGARLDPAELLASARRAAHGANVLVAEGAGGLLVPLTSGTHPYLIRDYARDLGLPLVIAARPGLGTINHTLLTLEAARSDGLDVRAVVLTPWPDAPSAMECSNRATIAELGAVDVRVLQRVGITPAELATAGASLADLALSRERSPAAA